MASRKSNKWVILAMVFTSISGTYSHYRENNLVLRIGLATGLFGAIGAFVGSWIADLILGSTLKWFTAGMMVLSAVLLWFPSIYKVWAARSKHGSLRVAVGPLFLDCGMWWVK
ncbi:MAG TPA: sulfite exporter TauE/SafE family protein [Candidatus Dormibacteraeota bacterium]|nr:sulfite exporter TauE/SafE family protein [Candidatus Dormibacteraeota bacterium]